MLVRGGLAMAAAASCLLLGTATIGVVHGAGLSISSPHQVDSLRAEAIKHLATQIKNEPRVIPINGENYPLYHGPLWVPGSLTTKIQAEEFAKIRPYIRPASEQVAKLAGQWAPDFTTMEDFVAFYDDVAGLMEKPMSTDISDETFGAQRHTIKGFRLRIVNNGEYAATADDDDQGNESDDDESEEGAAADHATSPELSLTDAQLAELCGEGVTVGNIRAKHQLFVSEYPEVSQYNDPAHKDRKYVTDVLGFFCYNHARAMLLPIEIRLLETGLTYTPFDTEDEWTLAKMALEATELGYQEMQHMAETHAMSIPMRVEGYRTMSVDHPVFELLARHTYADFALELLSARMLLNTSTEVDQTFGWGAVGAVKFLDHQLKHDKVFVSVANDFPTDIRRRGLEHMPTNKYVTYGKMYYGAFDAFVKAYLDVYYPTERALRHDTEVQNWAAACAKVPHLHDFPKKFKSKDDLRRLLVHVIFQSTFKHHQMNGASTWHAASLPYSIPALWKKLPTKKLANGEKLNLVEYTIPKELAAAQVLSPAMFYRAMPVTETLLDAYRTARFAEEPKLSKAIRAFEQSIREIDTILVEQEPTNTTVAWPLHLYRPSMLSYYTWI